MNEQQPHISLGAVVAVMLAGAVAAVALCVALPSYGQGSPPQNIINAPGPIASETCVLDSYGHPIGAFDPTGHPTGTECTKEMIEQSRKERPATKGDMDEIKERLTCVIAQLHALRSSAFSVYDAPGGHVPVPAVDCQ